MNPITAYPKQFRKSSNSTERDEAGDKSLKTRPLEDQADRNPEEQKPNSWMGKEG